MDLNKCIFIGKVKTAPQISEQNGQKQALIKFVINNRAPGTSGQWVDNFIEIDVFARDNKANVIENHVVAGQELTLECKYVNWEVDGVQKHAFQLYSVSLGFKPRDASPAASNVPAGPPL